MRTSAGFLFILIATAGFLIVSESVFAAAPTTGLVTHWKLDELSGTTASNSASSTYNGTLQSTPTWTAQGKVNRAVTLDGTDNIAIGNITQINNVAQVTLSAWVKRSALGGQVLFGKQSPKSSGTNTVAIEAWSDGLIHFGLSGTSTYSGGTVVSNDTDWHHVTLVFDGSLTGNSNRLKGYVDGTQRTLNFTGTVPTRTSSNTTPFNIGKIQSSYSNGMIDDVWVYSRALSSTEVLAVMNDNGGPDTTAPVITQVSAISTPTNDMTPDYVFSSTEAGVISYGGTCSSSTTNAIVGNNTITLNALANGTYNNCSVRVTDAANNQSTVLALPSFTIDTVAPTITSVSSDTASGVYGTGASIDIDLTFSEAVTATGNITVTLETGTIDRTCTLTVTNATTGTCLYTVQTGDSSLDLNTNSISGVIKDQAGNSLSNFSPTVSMATNEDIVVDALSPEVTIIAPLNNAVVVGSVLVKANASDTTSVAGVQFKMDGSNLGAEDTVSPFEVTWDTTLATEGVHTVSATARDNAGNVGTAPSLSVTVDNIQAPLPTVTLTANPMTVSAGGQTILTWSSTDTTSCTATDAWSGTKSTNGTATITGLQADSTFTLSCIGDGGSATQAVTVMVTPLADTTAPILSNGSPVGILPSATTTATLGVTTNEAASCHYALSAGISYAAMTGTFSTTTGLTHTSPLSGLASGNSYNYFVRCKDTLDNTNGDDYRVSFSVASQSGTTNPSFERVIVDPSSPIDPWMKSIADLDGDNLPDLIVSGAYGPVVWYQSPTWSKHTISTTGSSDSGSDAGDIDGDGDNDVIVGVVWYENVGNGASWVAHQLPNASAGTHDIYIADINNDGKMDLVMRGEDASRVFVFLQINKTTWTEFTLQPNVGLNGLEVSDINRDGREDIIVGGVWMENPGGSIATATWTNHIFATWDSFASIKVIDMNSDGRSDIVLSVSESVGKLSWFEAPVDPKTGPWVEHIISQSLNHVHQVSVQDFDRDGVLDVLASEFESPGNLTLYLQRAGGWQPYILGSDSLHNVQIADLDNDGDVDIFGVGAWSSIPVIIYKNTAPLVQKRVLIFSKTLGFRHASIPDGIAAIQNLGQANNFTVDATEDAAFFTDANLSRYQSMIFLNPSGDILDGYQRSVFQRFMENGGGFVGIHNPTAYVLEGWAWYDQLVGTRFDSEIENQLMKLDVVTAAHPSTAMLPSSWNMLAEGYNFTVNPKINGATVLINLDETSVSGGTMGADHPFSWFKMFDGGRSWYTVGGADTSDYINTNFIAHVLGGIRYSLGESFAPATNQVPTVTLTAPSAGSSFLALATISITANATDDGTIAGVEFYQNGTLIPGSIDTSAPYAFTWNGVSAGTYNLTAKATDGYGAVGTSSAVSVTVTPNDDVTAPSVATGLTVVSTTASQVTLSWNASVDNVGVIGYKIYRNGVEVGNSTTLGFVDTGLIPSTQYAYTVATYDRAGNMSAQTAAVNGTTLQGSPVALVQTRGISNDASASSASIAFTQANSGGNLIVVAVSWGSGAATPTVSDTAGNTYAIATNAYDSVQDQGLAVLYASDIKASVGNTVTVNFGSSRSYRRLLIHEYSGVAAIAPVDITAKNNTLGTTGTNAITSTSATTTVSGDLIFGVVMNDDSAGPTTITAGTGFLGRGTVSSNDLASEDSIQLTAGPIATTHTFGAARRYLSHMVAFKKI